MLRSALAAALAAGFALTFAPDLSAQTCNSGEFFFKNDVLPADPGTAATSVIQGLCEGEAAGCVMDVSSVATDVKVESVAVGFIQAGGGSGAQAAVNLKVYDGITFPGGIPTFGALALDFETATGSSIAVTSSGVCSAPGPGDPSITARSAAKGDPISPGMTRYYQVYYRDPSQVFCPAPTGNTFNMSSAVQITW